MPGDINGFDPFPGRWPAPDFFPGLAAQYTTHPDYKGTEGVTIIIERPDLWAKT